MACWSRVEQTQFRVADRLVEALRAVGFERVEVASGGRIVQGQSSRLGYVTFTRSDPQAAFVTVDGFPAGVAKKYGELSARAFAKSKGFALRTVNGAQFEFVKRG